MKVKVNPPGKSIADATRYALFEKGSEEELRGVIVAGNCSAQTPEDFSAEFGAVIALRPDIENPIFSFSFSLPPGEVIDDRRLERITNDLLCAVGIDPENHQFVAFRHDDTAHQHVHVYVNRIGLNAKVWNGGKTIEKFAAATPRLEAKYNLTRTRSLAQARAERDTQRVRGSEAVKKQPSERQKLREDVQLCKELARTFPEFVQKCDELGIQVVPSGKSGTVGGIVFHRDGFAISGNKLSKGLSWKPIAEAVRFDADADAALVQELRAGGEQLAEVQKAAKEANNLQAEVDAWVKFVQEQSFEKKATITTRRFESLMAEVQAETASEIAKRVRKTVEKDLVKIGADRLTTRQVLRTEMLLISAARGLAEQRHHDLTRAEVLSAIFRKEREASERFGKDVRMTAEQRASVAHGAVSGLASIQGSAGAGKSFLLETFKTAYEARGYKVLGSALSSSATQNLERETGIQSQNIAKLRTALEKGRLELDRKTLLVIDEAGLVGSKDLSFILAKAEAAGAKVVLSGEDKQLDAIQLGGALRVISRADVVGTARVETIQRQRESWARKAVTQLRDGHAKEAWEAYQSRGLVHIHDSERQTRDALIEDWKGYLSKNPEKQAIIITHSNDHARDLARRVREIRKEQGAIEGPEFEMRGRASTKDYKLTLAVGDRVRFTKNSEGRDGIGVINGTMGTVNQITPVVGRNGSISDYEFAVSTDDRGMVRFKASEYRDESGCVFLNQGYCTTVFSSQGLTIDGKAFVLQTPGMSRALTYVAASRAKDDTAFYVEREAWRPRGDERFPPATNDEVMHAVIAQTAQDNREQLALEHLGDHAIRQAAGVNSAERQLRAERLKAAVQADYETLDLAAQAGETSRLEGLRRDLDAVLADADNADKIVALQQQAAQQRSEKSLWARIKDFFADIRRQVAGARAELDGQQALQKEFLARAQREAAKLKPTAPAQPPEIKPQAQAEPELQKDAQPATKSQVESEQEHDHDREQRGPRMRP